MNSRHVFKVNFELDTYMKQSNNQQKTDWKYISS